jgi:hypothetical protein
LKRPKRIFIASESFIIRSVRSPQASRLVEVGGRQPTGLISQFRMNINRDHHHWRGRRI